MDYQEAVKEVEAFKELMDKFDRVKHGPKIPLSEFDELKLQIKTTADRFSECRKAYREQVYEIIKKYIPDSVSFRELSESEREKLLDESGVHKDPELIELYRVIKALTWFQNDK